MSDTDLEKGEYFTDRRSWANSFSSQPGFWKSQSVNSTSTSRTTAAHFNGGLTDDEQRQRETLISILVGDQIVKGTLGVACHWYAQWLESKFHSHWHLFWPSLNGLEDNSPNPKSGDLVIVYHFVISVLQLLKSKKDLALVEIVDKLDNEGLLKQQRDGEREKPNQIVFATVGWLSMLYAPVAHPNVNELEIVKTSTGWSGYPSQLSTRCYRTFKQGFDYIDSPLYSLFDRFGNLIPEAKLEYLPPPGLSNGPLHEVIKVQSVYFQALQSAELKIEWVSSLALHLELDTSKNTLKFFQFPSFCRMMYVDRKDNILSRLFNDYAERNYEDVKPPEVQVKEMFREILMTFRLIFGQGDSSWKTYSRIITSLEDQDGQATWENTRDCDPMLSILCENNENSNAARAVYDDVDANEPASYYDPNTEFPFFGKRLMELQQFTNCRRPYDLRALPTNRRDLGTWYAPWNNQILNAFAIITILFMILTLVFQGWQILLARQQLQKASTWMDRKTFLFW